MIFSYDKKRRHARMPGLRSMEKDGLITRTVYPEVPPRVEYALSELGESMGPILDSMQAWGEAYQELVKNNSDS